MKIAIGTKNLAKIEGVKQAFNAAYSKNKIEYFSFETNSKIKAQPLSDEEAITGAKNRAIEALKKCEDAEFGIGLEGTIDETNFGMFLCGWVVIIDKNNNIGIGSSPKILVPEWIAKRIRTGEELGPIVKELMDDQENTIRHSLGTCGVLTNGLYSRIDEFNHATLNALSIFIGKKYYKLK